MQSMNPETRYEQELKQIQNILHQVPQVEIPDGFHVRFQQRLHDEANLLVVSHRQKRRQRFFKLSLSIAACFVVGILSVHMYNNGIDPLEQVVSEPQQTMTLESADRQEPSVADTTPEPKMAPATENAPTTLMADPEPLLLRTTGEADGMATYSSTISAMEVETLQHYQDLIAEYLKGQIYVLESYSIDSTNQTYQFQIRITQDEKGNPLNRSLLMIGDKGEIYEQR